MKHRVLVLASFAIWLSLPSQVSAQATNLTGLSQSQLESQITTARSKLKRTPYDFCTIEPLIRELDRRQPNSMTRAEAEYDAAICALASNNISAMWQHTDLAEGLLPIKGGGKMRAGVETVALDIAAGTHDWQRYSAHVVHVAQMDDPAVFATVDGEKIFANLSQAPQPLQDQGYLAFAEASNFAALPDYFRQAIGEFATLPALQAGKRDLAIKMVNQVSDVDHVYPLLIDRRYSAIWPEIDSRVGANQSKVTADFVAFAKAEVAADAQNRWAFGDLVRSLVVAGRNREAITLYKTIPADPVSVAHYQPGDAWAINAAAVALDREGRRAEADAALDTVVRVPVEGNAWLLSIWHNRASRLAAQERWPEAFAAAKAALVADEKYGDGNQQTFGASLVVCIAPHGPADPIVDRAKALLVLNEERVPVAGASAALCRGDRVKAKALALAALRNDGTRYLAMLNMQPAGAAPLPVDRKSSPPDLGAFVRSDPELLAEFNLYGRMLPSELFPPISTEAR